MSNNLVTNVYAIFMDIVKWILTKFDGCSFKRNMQNKIKSLTCQHYYLAVMFSKYILKGQILLQNFGDLFWKTKLTNRVSQITAGMNMVTFGGLTKHFLTIVVEYFLRIYIMMNIMILGEIMKKVRTKTKRKKTTVALWHKI